MKRNLIFNRLDERLNELGWGSGDEVATQMNLITGATSYDRTTISKIRHARRPITDQELAALAEALDVDIYWLLGLSNVRDRPAHVRLMKDS